MKKKLVIFTLFFILLSISNVYSLESGKWILVKENDWCYVGSLPVKTDLPKEKKRGQNYIIVYKLIGNDENIVQIEAGYNYNLDKDIIVNIDDSTYLFYSSEDSSDAAWTDEDSEVIYAMRKGLALKLKGESSRGTITNDKYTLNGFTAAINKLNKDC